MKGIGNAFRKEVSQIDYTTLIISRIDYTALIRKPLHLRRPIDLVASEYTPTRIVPYIKVELHPVDNFCEGMAYEYMEVTKPDPKKVICIEMEITPVLIIHLDGVNETTQLTLHSMARAIEYKGLTTPDPWIAIFEKWILP